MLTRSLLAAALLLVSGDSPVYWPASSTRIITAIPPSSPVNPNAFYVALPPSGNDGNPGTFAAPFQTFATCRNAMRASGTNKTCYIRAGTYNVTSVGTQCTGISDAIELLSNTDAGEVWSYYPPDGVGSAILDGGSTGPGNGIDVGFCISFTGGPITITGLQMQRFSGNAIWIQTVNGAVVNYNTVHDINMSVLNGNSGIKLINAPNGTINNNYVYNTRDNGIGIFAGPGNMSGDTISNNFTYNTCTASFDCGAIYTDEAKVAVSTGITISNNYVRDSGVGVSGAFSPGAVAIYLDDGSSNHTITGNVMSGVAEFCLQVHGGANVTMTKNICDLSTNGGKAIVYYVQTTLGGSFPMTGNSFTNNIVIAGSSGAAGIGFLGDNSPPVPMSIQNNAYHNYVGSSVVSTGTNNAGSDSAPQNIDPQLNCWAYNINPASSALSPPVSFTALTGGWGPPGFAVTTTGTAPSSPHAC